MALADIPTVAPTRRLDSWKEIAEYIGRDVRTATRWEAQGMPLHRIPGGKGASVFAFTDEIDRWMAGPRTPANEEATAVATPSLAPRPSSRRIPSLAAVVVATALLAIAAGAFAMRGTPSRPLRATATSSAISVDDGSGIRIVHRFEPDLAVPIAGLTTRILDLNRDGVADIVSGISFFTNSAGRMTRGGELINLGAGGQVRWRFGFDDSVTFRDETVRGPWALSGWDATADGSHERIALAAHDYIWWASMVTIVDEDGHRRGTFVNPGWIESVTWLGPDRVGVAGFSNLRNEAIMALIDADAADGQAPGTPGTPFACASCSPHLPLFYAAFPRSELNLVTGSPFNRASVTLVGDRVVVTTSEDPSTATAIYEFDRNLNFLRARYSEGYWDAHGKLEREGRLAHTRAACPERDGPATFHIWNSEAGRWDVHSTLRAMAASASAFGYSSPLAGGGTMSHGQPRKMRTSRLQVQRPERRSVR